MSIGVSIVTYCPNFEKVNALCKSILASSLVEWLYIIDNSPRFDKEQFDFSEHPKVKLIFNDENIGYGAGHNIALRESLALGASYHLVINPDIRIQEGSLESIKCFMDTMPDIGQLMPKVHYPNGNIQKLCKLLPTPADLFARRFLSKSAWLKRKAEIYELKGFGYNRVFDVPTLSGCFMFLRASVLKRTGLFDERFFMYMEDVDLTRRIHQVAKTVFYPNVSIIHDYQKASYSDPKLLKYHISSAVKYFNKWGWLFDIKRKEANRKALEVLKAEEYH